MSPKKTQPAAIITLPINDDLLLRIDALVDILATVNPNIKNETRAARRTALINSALNDGVDIIQILVRTFNIR
jgi:hypothetical protein